MLSLLISGIFIFSTVASGLDLRLYDAILYQRVRHARHPLNPRILLADLNDSAEQALGEDLDNRRAFADFLSVLGGLNTRVGFDFIFPGAQIFDPQFHEGLEASRSIMAIAPVEEGYANFAYDSLDAAERALLDKNLWHIRGMEGGKIPQAKSFIMSNQRILGDHARLAHIGVNPDGDGVYRRAPLFFRWNDGLIPSLALALAVEELGVEVSNIEFIPGEELILPLSDTEQIRIPVDEAGSVRIPYGETWEDNEYRISFDKVARAARDDDLYGEIAADVSGLLVIAGDTTTAKRDYGITPVETVYPLSGIQAAILSGILDDYFIYDWSETARALSLIGIIIVMIGLYLLRSDKVYNILSLGILTLWTGGMLVLWSAFRIAPWYKAGAGTILVFWMVGLLQRIFNRYREDLLLKTALSRYFPRSLAERVISEGKTDLVPAYKELTMLFSDIAGFTRWSSDKEPPLVHGFLCEYLETMAGIIFSQGGTVDKFMGDGILAFFGDPLALPDHAERALKAAAAMQGKIREMAETWKAKYGIDLKVRIGINTGRVIVGNLGSETRIEYTVIGAAVNLAQRMESNAPVGGILVTAAVRDQVQGKFNFGEKREIPVKGYDAPIEAYEVLYSLS